MPTVTLPDGRRVTFPDGTSQEDMVSALSQLPTLAPSHESQEPQPTTRAPVYGRGPGGFDLRRAQRNATEALPTIGSTLGAGVGALTSPVTGPVGPVVGAGVGGASGTALQSLVQGESPDANAVIESGFGNAALQAVTPIGRLAAKGLYKGGVALLPKGLKQAAPNMAETGYREGIALTRRGAEKAGRLATASRGQADSMIAAAQAAGAKPIAPMEVLRALRPVGREIRTATALGASDEMPALMERATRFKGKGPVDLVPAQALKRKAQGLANTAYAARDKGAVINNTEALINEGQARGLRQALESRVSGLGEVNARTQALAGVGKGAEHASQTGHVLSRLGGAGVGGVLASGGGAAPALAAAGAGLALTTPGGLTATGLALKPIASHLPASVRAVLLLSLLGQEQDQ